VNHALFVPPFGELAHPRVVAEIAERAERAGWDGLFVWDHVQYRAPATQVIDPWIALAVAADRTERLQLGAMVTPLARRRPAIVARQLAALDLLSDGRMVLGVGLGLDSSGRELSSFGEELDDRKRAAMLDEALEVVHGLLSGEELHHHGAHFVADGARFSPVPARRLPTWVGARWPNKAPLRRAARFEGVFVIDVHSPDEIAELCTVVKELRPDGAPFDVVVDLVPGSDPEPWEDAGATWHLVRFSPFDLSLREVRAVADEGPPRRA
jgi:alkanesulfonate monooxygenase SsuD/methylene tetrahydromethanopterin reductase-like flavin-dependent oxidoreductase (luciferase family)